MEHINAFMCPHPYSVYEPVIFFVMLLMTSAVTNVNVFNVGTCIHSPWVKNRKSRAHTHYRDGDT